MLSTHQFDLHGKALPVRLSHEWARAQPVFDEEHLVSHAGLAPVMALAEQAGLSELVESRVNIRASRVKSAGANPAGKVGSIVAGMAAGADCIEHLNVLRAGGMAAMFGGVYAPATLGQFLREFTHGHGLQLASVLRAHLAGLVRCSNLLPGRDRRVFVDIDSLLRPVYGHAKQGASYGHTKIAGRQVLRKGLSPLITTISTDDGAPVIAGIRLRAGRAGSGKGAAKMIAEAINTARESGCCGEVLVRGDSAYGNSAVVAACQRAGARFSLVITRSRAVDKAIASIPDDAWQPVHYPGAVIDPDTGELISDAQVAEVALPSLRLGQPVAVTPAGAKEALRGTIRLIAPEVDKASRLGRVRVALDGNPSVAIGSFARGIIETGRKRAVTLPLSAITYTRSGATVQTVQDGKIATRKVTLGLTGGGRAEIATGLAQGETVVARAGTFVRDGDLITPVPTN